MPRRQPPLPRGPPPGRHNGSDSYRPSSPPPRYNNNENYRPQNRDMYHFGGSNSGPGRSYDDQRGPARYDDYDQRVPPARYDDHDYAPGRGPSRAPPGDSYRPPQGDFTYRHDAPPGINFDSYKPLSPRQDRDNAPRRNNHSQNNFTSVNPRAQGGQRNGYRGRGGPRLASDRAFLKATREPTPELMPGMVDDDSQVKFLALQDVEDSSGAEMDLSDGDDEQPKKKLARITTTGAADGDSVPQFASKREWSNPDPYTALPPPNAGEKKKDLVKMIQKARMAASTPDTKPQVVAEDFISFEDLDDNKPKDKPSKDNVNGIDTINAPSGPSGKRQTNGSSTSSSQAPRNGAQPAQSNGGNAATIVVDANPDLGSRKRTIRDEIKETPTLQQALATSGQIRAPTVHQGRKGKKPPSSGQLLQEWRGSSTPWIGIEHDETVNIGLRLHKEIMDFYNYVKPRNFEEFIRGKLVEDLQIRIKRIMPTADIFTFGSYPAGLYLPNADMDIVLASRSYMDRGSKELGQRPADCHKFASWLKRERLPLHDSVEVITKAKVPLVKYVDRTTGLKVDISFENDTGLVANNTFQDWKTRYPAMPIIVTLIKHLLATRGLNEPVNGGIGGFSVICLVVSLLQNMPQVISGNMVPEHHLGEIFMEFLDLYGNQFNWVTTGIQLNPPAYKSKAKLGGNNPYKTKLEPKFCIIDPNNSSNDISGGSSNTKTILRCFSDSYNDLQRVMGDAQYGSQDRNQPPQSLLACIFAGNYSGFQTQRDHLAHIHELAYGPISDDS